MTAVFNFLMITGAIQGLIFNIATLLSRRHIERPVLFLNLFVFFLSLNNLQSWIIEKGLMRPDSFFEQYTLPWYVLIVPMFYAFLIYYLEIEAKRLPFVWISCAIFFGELLVRSVVILGVQIGNWPPDTIASYNILEDMVTLSYSLFLFFKAIRILYKYEELYKPILAFDDLVWIKRFMAFGGIVFVLWILAIFFNITGIIRAPFSYYPLRLGSSILIYWVGYQAFFRYVILKDRILLRKEIRNDKPKRNKISLRKDDQGQQSEKGNHDFSEIADFIVLNQKYLDPYLSMEALAKELGVGTSSLSKLINTHAGSNFPDYINKLRVTEAKQFLADASFASYTIVAIGLECGFNSKSTFYTAFKKFTGQTPTAFRKKESA